MSAAGPCKSGETQSCSITLNQNAGILSCFHGTQACEGGVFGACEDGIVREQADLRGGLTKGEDAEPLALSSPTACVSNPCDPSCQIFIEDPVDITTVGGSRIVTSTYGSGAPPDWTSGAGVAPCSHSLCSEGDALNTSCHACVNKVCQARPSCCADTGGTTWDATCVGLAYTECLGQPVQSPLPAESLCDYSAFAEGRVRFVSSGTFTGGAVGANGSGAAVAVEVAGGATVDAVRTVGNASVGGGSVVLGTVEASGSISNGGAIGGEQADSDFSGFPIPARSIDCVAGETTTTQLGSQIIADGDRRVVRPQAAGTPVFTFEAPGRFGGFDSASTDARLVFSQPGTYTFSKLNLSSSSSFTLQLPNVGNVVIEVCGLTDAVSHPSPQLDLLGALQLVKANGFPAEPHQVQLYTNFSGSIPFVPGAMRGITLIAPLGRVYSTGSSGSAFGMVVAREVEFVTGINFSSAGFTGQSCQNAGVFGPIGGACPISLSVPVIPPPRRESCLIGSDCQVDSRCTDVATSSSCAHSKCVTGGALTTSCAADDPCVARICQRDASCCISTDGWTCLPGNKCLAAECGDGLIRGLEKCDDGNSVSGDGCSASCQVEPGRACYEEPSICRPTICGDGLKEGQETCDDGGLVPWDGCSESCVVEPRCPAQGGSCASICGDGLTLPSDAEECDDGNTLDGDGCSAECQIEVGFSCMTGGGAGASFIELPVAYRDFSNRGSSKHPDFESFEAEGRTLGMVSSVLAIDGRPAYTGRCEVGSGFTAVDCPTMGDWGGTASGAMTTSAANFHQWFHGSSQSRAYWDRVRLNYDSLAGSYVFNAFGNFYPMSGKPWLNGSDGSQWSAGTSRYENFGFTTEMHHWFEYKGGEELYFHGDDDVWVFINGRLALDLGGTHPDLEAKVTLSGTEACEEYTDWYGVTFPAICRDLGISIGNVYEISLFHADRHTDNSNFYLTLSGFYSQPSQCTSVCGDGLVTVDEVCDDGENDGGPGECAAGCRAWDETGVALGEWGGHCVELVKTECDAWCGAATSTPCTPDTCEVEDAGQCINNESGYVDSTCSGIDLTVGFGCDDYIPICNQGLADAPAGIELSFFPRAGHQFSTESPDPAWVLGTCTVTQPIASGTCVAQACGAALTSTETTVVVNADQHVPECSYLDNWTLKDPAQICPTTTGSAPAFTFREVYEAGCPRDATPHFGFLTWSGQTPGSSRVTFEGRLAESENKLASENFETLGIATSSPADTQSCNYGSLLAQCPVDVESQLSAQIGSSVAVNVISGETEVVSALELQITLSPVGENLPVLESWHVTYSCLYDQ